MSILQGVHITGDISPEFEQILTPEALALVAKLSRAFEPRRQELLAARTARTARLDAGERPDICTPSQYVTLTGKLRPFRRPSSVAVSKLPGLLIERW